MVHCAVDGGHPFDFVSEMFLGLLQYGEPMGMSRRVGHPVSCWHRRAGFWVSCAVDVRHPMDLVGVNPDAVNPAASEIECEPARTHVHAHTRSHAHTHTHSHFHTHT